MNIFLSFASPDRSIARRIQLALLGAEHEVFFDQASLEIGGDYNSRIREAIENSDMLVFLVSSHSVGNGRYAHTELRLAEAKWPRPWGFILPVVVEETDYNLIDPYLTAVTLLNPRGNIEAEVVAAVAHMSEYNIPLNTSRNIDYNTLRSLLKRGDWKAAEYETGQRMREAVCQPSDPWIFAEYLTGFPCIDLRTIDTLWVKYSRGKWGFSIQKRIYVECGALLDREIPEGDIWHEFCHKVGWRKGSSYVLDELDFNLQTARRGQFPLGGVGKYYWRKQRFSAHLFARVNACNL